jgi:hypothetical protein
VKNKDDNHDESEGPDKEAVFDLFKQIMSVCDEAIDGILDEDSGADILDMSNQVIAVMMAIEFSYVCHRNRLKYFMDSLNDVANTTVFDDEDVHDSIDYARICLQGMLKSVMIADKKLFKRSLEVVSLDDITDPAMRINVPKGGDA